MNPLTDQTTLGTVGELLVQLRLLQFDVQASPPLKDSGNDLIAIRGRCVRSIQVKATEYRRGKRVSWKARTCDLLAVVCISIADTGNYDLEKTSIDLLDFSILGSRRSIRLEQLAELRPDGGRRFELNAQRVRELFPA